MSSMYAVYHGPRRADRASPPRCTTGPPRSSPRGCATAASRAGPTRSSTRRRRPVPGRAAGWSRRPTLAASTSGTVDADRVGISCDEATTATQTLAAVWRRSGSNQDVHNWHGADASAGARRACVGTSDFLTAPGLQHPPFRDRKMLRYLRGCPTAIYALDRSHDPARLVHHEAQRHHRDGAGDLAGVRQPSTRSPRLRRQQPATHKLIGDLESWLAEITGYDRGLAAAKCRRTGRARRAAGDPRQVPPQPRCNRRAPQRLPHP